MLAIIMTYMNRVQSHEVLSLLKSYPMCSWRVYGRLFTRGMPLPGAPALTTTSSIAAMANLDGFRDGCAYGRRHSYPAES